MSVPLPAAVEALFAQGNRHLAQGALVQAQACFEEALEIVPALAALHANLAYVQESLGDLAGAEASYRRALECDPHVAQIHVNLGALLVAQKRLHEAELAFRLATVLAPEQPSAWANLGGLYASVHQDAQAEASCRAALRVAPDYPSAQANLAYVLLRQGRLREGWPLLEARLPDPRLLGMPADKRWQGESLVGKSVLLCLEAGHGDMLQQARFAALLRAHGARQITLMGYPVLQALLGTAPCVDQVFAYGQDLGNFQWDCWTPAMSVPHYLQMEEVPAVLPYLWAPPERLAAWRAHVPQVGLRVGLVWQGNPRFENDTDRSLASLSVLAPLAGVSGLQFISLQKDASGPLWLSPGCAVVELDAPLRDFADTAAVVAQLDLVISVDTAVAHLAGAMNRPCWVLLPHYKTDWRWLNQGDSSAWYPGCMRLFRQGPQGDWAPVIAAVAAALQAWAQASAPSAPSK